MDDEPTRSINRGDVFWVKSEDSDFPHPHVVVQDDLFNRSRITTVVVCALTSNLSRASVPGNVLLDAGEANLTRQSVVVVGHVTSVLKTLLGEFIGSLSEARVEEILAGMRFQQVSFLQGR